LIAMSVTILYFASLREALGQSDERIDLPPEIATISALKAHLAARGGPWLALLATKNLRAAVDRRMVEADATFADGAEIAFFPPVTGG
jgi:molybdopterin synthase sulfur carrier subunit